MFAQVLQSSERNVDAYEDNSDEHIRPASFDRIKLGQPEIMQPTNNVNKKQSVDVDIDDGARKLPTVDIVSGHIPFEEIVMPIWYYSCNYIIPLCHFFLRRNVVECMLTVER